jgi:hypothetical protein
LGKNILSPHHLRSWEYLKLSFLTFTKGFHWNFPKSQSLSAPLFVSEDLEYFWSKFSTFSKVPKMNGNDPKGCNMMPNEGESGLQVEKQLIWAISGGRVEILAKKIQVQALTLIGGTKGWLLYKGNPRSSHTFGPPLSVSAWTCVFWRDWGRNQVLGTCLRLLWAPKIEPTYAFGRCLWGGWPTKGSPRWPPKVFGVIRLLTAPFRTHFKTYSTRGEKRKCVDFLT